jgi:hypothetical protein
MIFDKEGMPRTVGLSLAWTILLALFSCGILFLPLGLYLAYWVRVTKGRSVAFWCYAVLSVVCLLEYTVELPSFHSAWIASGTTAIVFFLIYSVAPDPSIRNHFSLPMLVWDRPENQSRADSPFFINLPKLLLA